MVISKRPYFPKGSWVRVQHPKHPYHDRIGQIAIAGKEVSEVDFLEDDGTRTRKPLMNYWLAPEKGPLQLEKGAAILVTERSHPLYLRRGTIRNLIAGNEIALVDFGEKFTDEAGDVHAILSQIHRDDFKLLDSGSSSGTDKGDRKIRSAQG